LVKEALPSLSLAAALWRGRSDPMTNPSGSGTGAPEEAAAVVTGDSVGGSVDEKIVRS